MSRNRFTLFPLSILSAVIWMSMLPVVACSQDTGAAKPAEAQTAASASQTTPTSSPPSPALAPATAQPPIAAVQAPEKKKPKKVWTNEELKSVKTGVSVVGDVDKNSSPDYPREDAADYDSQELHQQQLESYRNQIQKLRGQIDAIDKRIAQLKDFKADNTSASGGIKMHQGYNMVPLEEQVKQLESKKKELQAKIDDIENETRKNGIEPGELR